MFRLYEVVWVKRESGENPERSRHCVREFAFKNTEFYWEGKASVDRSQETCLILQLMICGLRILIYYDC